VHSVWHESFCRVAKRTTRPDGICGKWVARDGEGVEHDDGE
jgi:hypothetical protein